MPHATLLGRRGNHADIANLSQLALQRCQSWRIDSVVVRQQDLHTETVSSAWKSRKPVDGSPSFNPALTDARLSPKIAGGHVQLMQLRGQIGHPRDDHVQDIPLAL